MTRHQKGYLYKASGAWHVRYRENVLQDNGSVKTVQVSKRVAVADYSRKTDVWSVVEEMLRPVNEGAASPGGTMQLTRFVEAIYFPYAESQKRASTAKGYRNIWNNYLKGRIGSIRVRDFRTCDGERLLHRIARECDISRATLKHIKSVLSAVFKHAKRCGALDGINPVQDVSIPAGARESNETRAYSLEEILKMLEVLPELAATAIASAAFAGLRKGEVRGLLWENYTASEIWVTQSVWNKHVSGPKTRSSKAPVPVISPLARILDRHRIRVGSPTSGLIFAAHNGSPLHLDNLARRVIRPKLIELGLQWHGWHAFRRGLATNLYRLRVPDKTIQAILRHANLSTTMNVYVKSVSADSAEAMRRLETLCNESALVAVNKAAAAVVN